MTKYVTEIEVPFPHTREDLRKWMESATDAYMRYMDCVENDRAAGKDATSPLDDLRGSSGSQQKMGVKIVADPDGGADAELDKDA